MEYCKLTNFLKLRNLIHSFSKIAEKMNLLTDLYWTKFEKSI